MAKNKVNTKALKARVEIIKDSALLRYLPDPNEMVTKSPKGLKIYDDMLLDAKVASLFYDRRNATQNLPLLIDSTDHKQIQTFTERHLTEKTLRKFSWFLLTGALKYGYRPAEVVWEQDEEGYYYIDSLIGHDINKYKYNKDGDLLYVRAGGTTKLDDPFKWIVHTNEGDRYNNPYGEAYMKAVYWAWQFKKLGFEFWMAAAEKFSVPTVLALFEQSDPEKAQEYAGHIANALTDISSGSAGALANTSSIQQLDMAGSVADFNTLIQACDLQIAYGMTGQALATNVSETGTQALGTVQERTKGAFYENDARALSYTIQKLIDWSIEVNFGANALAPQIVFDTGDKASFNDVMVAIDKGIPVSKKALYTQYNLPEPDSDDDVFMRPANTVAQPFSLGAYDFADNGEVGKKKAQSLKPMIVLMR